MKINKFDYIDDKHQSHYWYGGECVEISHRGFSAYIAAIGDVRVSSKYGDFKDKNNSGRFYQEYAYYIKSDDELYKSIEQGLLDIQNNNWWECYLVDNDENQYDLEWCLDSSLLSDAIKEVRSRLDDVIDEIKCEKKTKRITTTCFKGDNYK